MIEKKKARVEDVLHATRAAGQQRIAAGGGMGRNVLKYNSNIRLKKAIP